MTYIIAEIGINHDGSLQKAKSLIYAAADAGANAVKFQKRDPELAVPKDQWHKRKMTPWGEEMDYIDYKKKMEFWYDDYVAIKSRASSQGLDWSVSVWDKNSVYFMEQFKDDIPWIKIPSAKITDLELLEHTRRVFPDKEVIMSTGMSTRGEIRKAMMVLGGPITIMHCNSQYPAPIEDLNLRAMEELWHEANTAFGIEGKWRIGYSGHEVGLATTVAAVALGAEVIERHITLDRSDVGTDHASSVEPVGFARLVKDIRAVERALGDGILGPSHGEQSIREKLRG